jgi:hypothetical protein
MVMKTALLVILKNLLVKLLTEKFVGALIVALLEYASKQTTNTVDDELVAKVKGSLDA